MPAFSVNQSAGRVCSRLKNPNCPNASHSATEALTQQKPCDTPSLPHHPIPPFHIHIKRFALISRVVENLVEHDGEIRGGRFAPAFEHSVRHVVERKSFFSLPRISIATSYAVRSFLARLLTAMRFIIVANQHSSLRVSWFSIVARSRSNHSVPQAAIDDPSRSASWKQGPV